MSLHPHTKLVAKLLVSGAYETLLFDGYDSFVADEPSTGSSVIITRRITKVTVNLSIESETSTDLQATLLDAEPNELFQWERLPS